MRPTRSEWRDSLSIGFQCAYRVPSNSKERRYAQTSHVLDCPGLARDRRARIRWLHGAPRRRHSKLRRPPPSCSQATAFLARNGNANAAATTAFICGGVTDGWWSKWDILYLHATDTSAHALLNLESTSYTGALVATNPTFTANQGFTGNASGVVDTTWVPSNGGNYTLNSASAFVCILTPTPATEVWCCWFHFRYVPAYFWSRLVYCLLGDQ